MTQDPWLAYTPLGLTEHYCEGCGQRGPINNGFL